MFKVSHSFILIDPFRILQTLGVIEKSIILNFKRERVGLLDKHRNKELTNRPKIDPNSEEIVQQSELHGMDVVDRL